MNAVLAGLPALAGVLAGIGLVLYPIIPPAPALPILLLTCLFVARSLSRSLFNTHPRLALVLLEPWVLSAVCIVALCAQALLWLALALPGHFIDLPEARREVVAGALLGAVTTYLATAWTKDVQESKGFFLPATQFRRLGARFIERHRLTGDTLELEACDAEVVARADISGWGLASRWKRAGILSQYLRNKAG